MEGTPLVAQHLLQLANNLAVSKNHRSAALAFSAAAQTSGVSPRVQAFALYKSSLHLQAYTESHPVPATTTADRHRALSQVRKCLILIRNQPASLNIRLQLTALLERIYTSAADHLRAAKTINDGLACITTHQDRAHVIRWWVYFRGRAIRNALATGNSMHHAAHVAEESAKQCHASGDFLSAAAFYLANFQILLSVRAHVSLDFVLPETCLAGVEKSGRRENDVNMLSAGMHLLHTLFYIRLGKVGDAKKHAIDPLIHAYEQLRSRHKSNKAGSWHWFTAKVTSAITNHCVAIVGRIERAERSRAAAAVCLKRIGYDENSRNTLDQICRACGTSPTASRALAISMLESAARLRLAKLELPNAARYIAAASRLAFEDAGERQSLQRAELYDIDLGALLSPQLPSSLLTLRCCVMLLFAEYHCLRGMLSGAQAAMRFLRAIQSLPQAMRSEIGEVWNADVLQAALSHLSLLTGEERQNVTCEAPGEQNALTANNFVDIQCYSIALLTMGIYYMRRDMVIDSLGALTGTVQITLNLSTMNPQIAANALTIRSAPGLAHQTVSSSPSQDIEDAMSMAKELHDPVLMARVARQRRKLVHRLGQPANVRAAVDQLLRAKSAEMTGKQKHVGVILQSL